MTARNLFGELALESTLQQIRDALGPAATEETAASLLETILDMQSPSGAMLVSGTKDRFRDGFTTGTAIAPVDPDVWALVNDAPDTGNGQGHIVLPGGDSQGSAYLRVSLSPFVAGSGVHLTSKEDFSIPIRHAWGVSMSQRVSGQEIVFGLAESLDGNGSLGLNTTLQPGDIPITGNVVVASNVATVTAANHGLKGGDRVILMGTNKRILEINPVYVTPVDINSFTIPLATSNQTFTAPGGFARIIDPSINIKNCLLQLWGDTNTATNSTYVSRRNGSKTRYVNAQVGSTSSPTLGNTNPFSDSAMSTGIFELWANIDEAVWRSWSDGTGGIAGYTKFQQSIPDETLRYKLYCRARNNENLSKPIARIVSISRSGTTIATVTTDVPHGLSVGDLVAVTGVRDTANFTSDTSTAVSTIVSPTVFTLSNGAQTTTATDSNGGTVWWNRGTISAPGLITNGVITSVSCVTAGVLVVTCTAAPTGPNNGDYVNIYGLNAATRSYEGAYRLGRVQGSNMELIAPGVTPFGAISTGGSVIRRTDVRLHFARILSHTRQMVEVMGGRGSTADSNNSVPISIVSSPTLSVNATTQMGLQEAAPASTTVLGAGAVYTGSTNDSGTSVSTRHNCVRILVSSTAGLSPGILNVEESTDNTTFRATGQIPVPADGQMHQFDFPLTQRYFRVKFTNGGTLQTAFYIGFTTWRADSRERHPVLPFFLTVPAGQAATASAVTTFTGLDLGWQHRWSLVRTMMISDVTGSFVVQQSMDGTNWVSEASVALAANVVQNVEHRIWGRWVRLVHTNGAGAAAAVRASQTLIPA